MAKSGLVNTLLFNTVVKKYLGVLACNLLARLDVDDVENFLTVSPEQLSAAGNYVCN